MLNAAHLHIMLVHFPVVLVPVATVLLLLSLWREDSAARHVALGLFLLAALVAIPAFLLGDGAAEIVQHLAGVTAHAIDEHEEAADVGFWMTLGLGLCGTILIARPRHLERFQRHLLLVTTILGVATSVELAIVANRGGAIRHSEISDHPRP